MKVRLVNFYFDLFIVVMEIKEVICNKIEYFEIIGENKFLELW